MGWIVAVLFQLAVFALGVRDLEERGLWSWGKALFTLAFLVLESAFLLLPLLTISGLLFAKTATARTA